MKKKLFMYNVRFSSLFMLKPNNFVNNYLSVFVDRFNDSGIFDENIIVSNYIEKSNLIKKNYFIWYQQIFWM